MALVGSVYTMRNGSITRTAFGPMAAGFLVLLTAASSATAQTYPNKPIKIVVAFAPGCIADTAARLVGQSLSERLGQSVVVENRGGAGGLIAAKLVSSAPPDGYTVLVTTTAVIISALAAKNSVDPARQLTPLSLVASTPDVFAVHKSAGDKTLRQFTAEKANGQFTYSTAGVGAIVWDLETNDALWDRLYKNFTTEQIVELGFFMAITMGQGRWLRTLGIEHHQFLAGTSAAMAPGFENMEALKRSKADPSYWANQSNLPASEAAE